LLKIDFSGGGFAVIQFATPTNVTSECDLVVWIWEQDKHRRWAS